MSIDYQYESLDIKNFGTTVHVPDNYLAKLMYYLSCARSVIQYDINNKYTDQNNYALLTADEEEDVVDYAKLLEPDYLIEKKLFLVGENYLRNYSSNNKFFEVSNNQFGLHISSEIMIAGVARKVSKIMVCRESWLKENYYDPMDYYNRKRKTCCYKFCKCMDCFACCFDSCCSCCDNDHSCSNCCKKVCCLIILGIIISLILIINLSLLNR